MKRSFGYFGFIALALAALYLVVPACGSNSNNPASPYGMYPGGYPGGYNCIPGQPCTPPPGGSGIPLLNGYSISVIDSHNSVAQLTFGGQSVIAGQVYNGPMTVTGIVTITPGGMCPPGQYQLTGQGVWQSQYAGGVGGVQASFQLMGGMYGGMQGQMSGIIHAGQDPYNPQIPTQYYMTGTFATNCDPTGVAN
jgi:hypothetical protein